MPDLSDYNERSYELRMFPDRRTAGRQLAQALITYAGTPPLVLGLPRGGVPVADEVARVLGGTLDVWVVRKLGAPFRRELRMGAIAEGPTVVIDRAIVRELRIGRAELLEVARGELREMSRRVERFRHGRPVPDVGGRTVILVDDGIATGGTMRAAIRAVRKRRPARLVLAVPVAPADVIASLHREVDEVVCLHQPPDLDAIGLWYEDFRQVRDEEVARILAAAAASVHVPATPVETSRPARSQAGVRPPMTPPASFDLVEEVERMRAGARASGHVAKTLVRSTHLRLVLMALRRGAEIPVHHAEGALTVHALDGRVQIIAAESKHVLAPGQLLVLEPEVPHALSALEDSAILLSIAWRGHRAA